jgi:hypothetical protein
LASAFADGAARAAATVLEGGGWESGGAPAYWPWIQALRSLVRTAGIDVRALLLPPRAHGTGAATLSGRNPGVPVDIAYRGSSARTPSEDSEHLAGRLPRGRRTQPVLPMLASTQPGQASETWYHLPADAAEVVVHHASAVSSSMAAGSSAVSRSNPRSQDAVSEAG